MLKPKLLNNNGKQKHAHGDEASKLMEVSTQTGRVSEFNRF
jgi:hypothetical protein